jgi:hypothetical protein
MPYELSDEEKRPAELALQPTVTGSIEHDKQLQQKYHDPATSERDKERINSFLTFRPRTSRNALDET